MRALILLGLISILIGCQEQNPKTAQEIVDAAILSACPGGCDQVKVQFDFRDKHYKSSRDNGMFTYERIFKDSLGLIRDQLRNDGFTRFIDDQVARIPDSLAFKYSNSVNSVHYFAQLPFGLNDPAVQKEYLGLTVIGGKSYHSIQITFRQEGGGKDFEDQFMYWFAEDDLRLEFLAYNYITDGGGVRLREAFNLREIDGIWFSDYRNYKPVSKETPLTDLPALFEAGELELLSLIELENVIVDRS
ncbi:DUF6503 family protein [Aureitalea marina]|uniref:Deoxyribose-phosphate aldolase n=1 Tax=Aureitalea marina TaxID=930804 RepID=A0A2S7KN54_9FLAO|nr:DUF6503 family protein [Aureitalea marina]PQB04042.1 hypothetical protein BST85_03345 [Aureitalea marina]